MNNNIRLISNDNDGNYNYNVSSNNFMGIRW